MSKERDGIWLGGVGSDIFGEHQVAQLAKADRVNDFLLLKYLGDYLSWHAANHRFHDEFKADWTRQKRLQWYTYGLSAGGFIFAATVVNPNFTHRNSYYLRRTWPVFFAMIGYQWGRKLESHNLLCTMLRMNDYFPLEVKRALQTKDFRHLQTFNYKNPDRVLFDSETGKSLS